MHFLKLTYLGMKRRLFSSILMFIATTCVLISGATLTIWSYWISGQGGNIRAERMASVYIDSADKNIVTQSLEKIRALPKVETARLIAIEEFLGYLQKNFPDIAEAMQGMSADAFPSMIEVVLPRNDLNTDRDTILEQIRTVPGVSRVDNGAKQLGPGVHSLVWLSRGATLLGLGLWVVLLVVALGHFQSIRYKDAQEIVLLRSFGAGLQWILLPWLLEAFFYAAAGACVAVSLFWYGKKFVVSTFNQFFEALGFDTFALNMHLLLWCGLGMFIAGFLAQALGGLAALVRGNTL